MTYLGTSAQQKLGVELLSRREYRFAGNIQDCIITGTRTREGGPVYFSLAQGINCLGFCFFPSIVWKDCHGCTRFFSSLRGVLEAVGPPQCGPIPWNVTECPAPTCTYRSRLRGRRGPGIRILKRPPASAPITHAAWRNTELEVRAAGTPAQSRGQRGESGVTSVYVTGTRSPAGKRRSWAEPGSPSG